jgi:hypothetical protein
MACSKVNLPGGGYAIICGLPKPKVCHYCHKPSDVLCDYPITPRKGKPHTCDRPCCRSHAKNVGEDKDYCVTHALHDAREKALSKCAIEKAGRLADKPAWGEAAVPSDIAASRMQRR